LDRERAPILKSLETSAERLDLGKDTFTTPTCCITLADSLVIAFSNNRDYQSRKEDLFMRSLSLTGVRWDYGNIFSAGANYGVTRSDPGADGDSDGKTEWYGAGGLSVGAKRLLATGASVSLGVTHDFVHFLTHGARTSQTNGLSLEIVQPLLRGAGSLVAREGLCQAERDMIYAVRDFQRYQQSFLIEVAQRYFGILQDQDLVKNAHTNYLNVLDNLRLMEILVRSRQRSQLDADQARQNVLDAEVGWNESQVNYQAQLDDFKRFLGMPLDLNVAPDRRELEEIQKRGLVRPDMELPEALQIAQKNRLDLKNALDKVEDARRQVEIALREFLPSLNARYLYARTMDSDLLANSKGNNHSWSLDLDLPLDWTPRRNQYRAALIALDRAQRASDDQKDALVLEVRDAWRRLELYRKNYAIKIESVNLAARRVEGTVMMLANGLATAREMSQVQDELLAAKNALTAALVAHTIQRLEFWNAIEHLKIEPTGTWYQ
jgi:outer membrane protein TolC